MIELDSGVLILGYTFVVCRSVANFFLLFSRLIVFTVLANGFSSYFLALFCLSFSIQFTFFINLFKNFDTAYSDAYSPYYFKNFIYIIKYSDFAMAKMFLNFEDIDLKNVQLFFLNILLHFMSIFVCISATTCHFVKTSFSVELNLYFLSFVLVELCILLSILIEYFLIKALVHKALKIMISKIKEEKKSRYKSTVEVCRC